MNTENPFLRLREKGKKLHIRRNGFACRCYFRIGQIRRKNRNCPTKLFISYKDTKIMQVSILFWTEARNHNKKQQILYSISPQKQIHNSYHSLSFRNKIHTRNTKMSYNKDARRLNLTLNPQKTQTRSSMIHLDIYVFRFILKSWYGRKS